MSLCEQRIVGWRSGRSEGYSKSLSARNAPTDLLLPTQRTSRLVSGPRASGTHFLKKEQFPFPPGSQVHGTTVCDALLPHSRPRPIWPVAKRVELWAVHLALWQWHLLVRTDKTAAVSYINRLGGIRSHHMSQLARHLLLWSPTHFTSLRAVHIPGKLNRAADALSRQLLFPGEWRLHPETIRLIWSRLGEAQVNLFASPESSHCQLYFSLTECPLGTEALAHSGHTTASRSMELPCVAPGQDAADLSGLPPAVVETIIQAPNKMLGAPWDRPAKSPGNRTGCSLREE